jgi:GNAT superfamily N-acetyltransferase
MSIEKNPTTGLVLEFFGPTVEFLTSPEDYLSDLSVDVNFQEKGIGTQLISLTQSMLGPQCKIILLAGPSASNFYPRIGFEPHSSAWILPRNRRILG